MNVATPIQPPSTTPYVPDAVEIFGRRLKMEYVGMASVFTVIAFLIFGDLAHWGQIVAATLATFGLFLGLKKKSRDHLVTSFLMFAAAVIAHGAVAEFSWAVPYLFLAACAWAVEGYMETRPKQIFVLPFIFVPWVLLDPSWLLGLLFLVLYLIHPWNEKPELRRQYVWVVTISAALSAATMAVRFGMSGIPLPARIPLDSFQKIELAVVGLPTLMCLLAYRSRLDGPRKWSAWIFGAMAFADTRLLAVFGISATILLAATVFRNSADSPRIRPFLKHTEWYYFWFILGVAGWAVFYRLG